MNLTKYILINKKEDPITLVVIITDIIFVTKIII